MTMLWVTSTMSTLEFCRAARISLVVLTRATIGGGERGAVLGAKLGDAVGVAVVGRAVGVMSQWEW